MRSRVVALMLVAALSMGVAQYSAAAQWFSDYFLRKNLLDYTISGDARPAEEKAAELAEANAYNQALAQHQVTLSDETTDVAYQHLLAGAHNATMATISIPKIDVILPVLHGTTDDVLALGAGHYYGSSLPVGGPSTHTAITAHSGLVTREFFTKVPDLDLGDEFTINSVAGDLHYRITNMQQVRPDEAADLIAIVPGQDLATLITCVPIGINTHRLLVTGERVAGVGSPDQVLSFWHFPGFPWWAVWILSAILGAWAFGRFVLVPHWRRQDEKASRAAARKAGTERVVSGRGTGAKAGAARGAGAKAGGRGTGAKAGSSKAQKRKQPVAPVSKRTRPRVVPPQCPASRRTEDLGVQPVSQHPIHLARPIPAGPTRGRHAVGAASGRTHGSEVNRVLSSPLAALMLLSVLARLSGANLPPIDPTATYELVIHKHAQSTRPVPHSVGSAEPPNSPSLAGARYALELVTGYDFDRNGTITIGERFDLTTERGWENAARLAELHQSGADTAQIAKTRAYPDEFITNEFGVAVVPALHAGLYLVTETRAPAGYRAGQPFFVTMPMTNPDARNEWLPTAHVYPKNDPTPSPGPPRPPTPPTRPTPSWPTPPRPTPPQPTPSWPTPPTYRPTPPNYQPTQPGPNRPTDDGSLHYTDDEPNINGVPVPDRSTLYKTGIQLGAFFAAIALLILGCRLAQRGRKYEG